MRAWRFAPGDHESGSLVIQEVAVDTPELAGDSALVRVQACVLGQPEKSLNSDFIPGGAAVGTVVQAGAEAEHLLGRRVVFGPEQACGECDICRRAVPCLCPHGEVLGRTQHGALAELVRVRARWVCALDNDLSCPALKSPAAALLGREGAWAYTMFARAGVAPGEPVFIVGSDIVARLLIEIAVAKGARPMVVHASDLTGYADWLASQATVSVPVSVPDTDANEIRVLAENAASTGGHGRRPWYVFETSGLPAGRSQALALCGPGARLTWLSANALGHRPERKSERMPEHQIDLAGHAIADMDATLVGVAGAHPDLFPELAALVVRDELDIESAAHVVELQDVPQVVRALAAESVAQKLGPERALIAKLPTG